MEGLLVFHYFLHLVSALIANSSPILPGSAHPCSFCQGFEALCVRHEALCVLFTLGFASVLHRIFLQLNSQTQVSNLIFKLLSSKQCQRFSLSLYFEWSFIQFVAGQSITS